jgi:hypothetical protein
MAHAHAPLLEMLKYHQPINLKSPIFQAHHSRASHAEWKPPHDR